MDRRTVIGAALALPWLASCRGKVRQGGDIVAAGNPAALLVYALAPERLAGWAKRPSRETLAVLGKRADLPELGALNASGAPAGLEVLAAHRPSLILDYGDADTRVEWVGQANAARIGVRYRLLDGELDRTPQAIRLASELLALPPPPLLALAGTVLSRWRRKLDRGPSFYYARGSDGLETGFAGALATDVLEGAGWRNVARPGRPTIERVAVEQIVLWDPEIVVTLDAGFARRAMNEPVWRQRRQGKSRRVLLLPALPFGWIDRPPSLNRLIGCAWLSGGMEAAAAVSKALYRVDLPPAAAYRPQWLA